MKVIPYPGNPNPVRRVLFPEIIEFRQPESPPQFHAKAPPWFAFFCFVLGFWVAR